MMNSAGFLFEYSNSFCVLDLPLQPDAQRLLASHLSAASPFGGFTRTSLPKRRLCTANGSGLRRSGEFCCCTAAAVGTGCTRRRTCSSFTMLPVRLTAGRTAARRPCTYLINSAWIRTISKIASKSRSLTNQQTLDLQRFVLFQYL